MEGLGSHARVRMQQRAISAATLERLLTWGKELHDHRGATIPYLDKRSRGGMGSARSMKVYAVIGSDGLIKTIGHSISADKESVMVFGWDMVAVLVPWLLIAMLWLINR